MCKPFSDGVRSFSNLFPIAFELLWTNFGHFRTVFAMLVIFVLSSDSVVIVTMVVFAVIWWRYHDSLSIIHTKGTLYCTEVHIINLKIWKQSKKQAQTNTYNFASNSSNFHIAFGVFFGTVNVTSHDVVLVFVIYWSIDLYFDFASGLVLQCSTFFLFFSARLRWFAGSFLFLALLIRTSGTLVLLLLLVIYKS